VVVTFRPPGAVLEPVEAVEEAVDALELDDELLEEPQPASASNAAHATPLRRHLFICALTLA
jgi:hypothetical protein